MSVPRARRRPGRWSPQTFRVRLTLLFAALFLAVGAALLGITYALAASVPDAGAMAGLSKPRSYAAAKDGSMPTIKIAGAMKVPLKRWRAILNGDENP